MFKALVCLGILSFLSVNIFALNRDGQGWTIFPVPPTQIYVSTSDGNDSNLGLTPESAKKTIKGAKDAVSILDPLQSYAVLLKKGDTFQGGFIQFCRSGKSADEPNLYSSYGNADQRPIIEVLGPGGGFDFSCAHVSNIAIVGLQFQAKSNNNLGAIGIAAISGGENLWIEDVAIGDPIDRTRGMQDAMIVTGGWKNVEIRRSVILDSYAAVGGDSPPHSQGLFSNDVNGLLVEECVFDHNGWSETALVGGEATPYNHNLYIQGGVENFKVINNIIINGSSHGVSSNAHGTALDNGSMIEDNLFIRNSYNIFMRTEYSTAINNVILDAKDINPTHPLGVGISVGRVYEDYPGFTPGPALVQNNLIVGNVANGDHSALEVRANSPAYPSSAIFMDNVVYHWNKSLNVEVDDQPVTNDLIYFISNIFQPSFGFKGSYVQIDQTPVPIFQSNIYSSYSPNPFRIDSSATILSFAQWKETYEHSAIQMDKVFPDPSRSIASYQLALKKEPTLEAFMLEARKLSKSHLKPEYFAHSFNHYMRQGFAMEPYDVCDFDLNGFFTGDDIDAFMQAFQLGTIVADFDNNGFVTGEDFDQWNEKCI